jgi:hypothetical protein
MSELNNAMKIAASGMLVQNVRVRVICISGYAEETFRKRLGEDRDIHFLPKPLSLAQLACKVKEVMDKVPA